MPTFAETGYRVISETDPNGSILRFLTRNCLVLKIRAQDSLTYGSKLGKVEDISSLATHVQTNQICESLPHNITT
jgi:hypothetical protein